MPDLGGLGLADLLGGLDDQQLTGYMAPAPGEDATAHGATGQGQIREQAFQYWPESISDTKETGWAFRDVPGGSHPIAYWTQGGVRVISFTAVFSTDVQGSFSPLDLLTGSVPEAVISQPGRNPDLRAAAKWIRFFTYPIYTDEGTSKPPPKLLLVMPGLQLGHDGADDVLVVLTNSDIQWLDFWPDGSPRRMEATLSFAEVVQENGQVTFQGRDTTIANGGWGSIDYNMRVKKGGLL